jgi:Zn-finger domain-containing protein
MKHPYYDYSLDDALSLVTILKKDQLLKESKMTEARRLTPFTADNLEVAIQVMREEFSFCAFNWITGRVALQVLRAANGEDVKFTS